MSFGSAGRAAHRKEVDRVQVIGSEETTEQMCQRLYRMDAMNRINLIRSGVPARFAQQLLARLDGCRIGLLDKLMLSRTAVARLARGDRTLPQFASERVVELARLVGQVQVMVEESGDPDGFSPARWLSRWLDSPVPALGGCRPVDYLDTVEGIHAVSDVLRQMQSGVYA